MACNTCGHTMQGLTEKDNYRLYWCPRCGMLKTITGSYSPKNAEEPFIEIESTMWGRNIRDAARLDEVKEDVVMEEIDIYAAFKVIYQNMENEKSVSIEMIKAEKNYG